MFTTLISKEALTERLNDPDTIIIDCRYDLMQADAGKNQYEEAHIKGALFADVHDDLSGPPLTDHGRHPLPSEAALSALFSRLGITTNSQVVVYDAGGGCFAARLWWLLRYMGHESVALLDRGWPAWQEAGLPSSSGQETTTSSEFTGKARSEWLVTLENIEDAKQLIDSRDPARYRGDVEPIDKAAGHIPGAKNHFWKANLNENDQFKSPEELQQQFQSVMDVDSKETVFYCGSGVTACHNILAVTHAGLAMPRLYAGSWSDWCADDSRAVATGSEP